MRTLSPHMTIRIHLREVLETVVQGGHGRGSVSSGSLREGQTSRSATWDLFSTTAAFSSMPLSCLCIMFNLFTCTELCAEARTLSCSHKFIPKRSQIRFGTLLGASHTVLLHKPSTHKLWRE